ncbi:MAG TPA: hypothetical protein ENK48_01735 [Gammaproteobacteria bacterium]|nr:hypothetical protein [Gammaproteobacteria bacterium]
MRILPVLLALMLAACAVPLRHGEAPDWVDGAASAYPTDRYLLGRGRAATLALAQDRARADLAKGLEVAVAARTREAQRFVRADGETGRQALEIDRRLVTTTSGVLRGVEIADIWRAPGGDYHVLAVLDRQAMARRLRREIAELDRQTGTLVDQARRADDPLAAIAAAGRAVDLQAQRASRARLLSVLAAAVPPRWPLAKLRADREALLRRLAIAVKAAPGEARLVELLGGAVSAAGLRLVAADEADYILSGRLELAPPEPREGWQWIRGRLSITLARGDGRVRGTHRWSFKAAALSAAEARRRAVDEAARLLRAELLPVLLSLAGGR